MIGDDLYVYGGHLGSPHLYAAGLEGKELQKLTLKKGGQWQTASTTVGRTGVSLVAHNGKLYRIGGFEARNPPEDEKWDLFSTADFAQYDPATGEWTDLAPLPDPRSSHDAAMLGDKLYVFGGWKLEGGGDGKWHDIGCVYDFAAENPKWEPLPKSPFFRRALAVAAYDNKLYVLGGIEDTGNITTKVGVFDPATGKWSEGPALPGEGMDGFGTSAFGTQHGLYATTFAGHVFRLTSGDEAWQAIGMLQHPRFFHRLVAKDDGSLVVVGGTSRRGKVQEVESFRIDLAPAK
jgi:N-acetylneuraminic acid mutarotase